MAWLRGDLGGDETQPLRKCLNDRVRVGRGAGGLGFEYLRYLLKGHPLDRSTAVEFEASGRALGISRHRDVKLPASS